MTRKVYPYMAALAMLMANDKHFSLDNNPKRIMSEAQRKRYDEMQRERAHRLNPVDLSEREFIIKGESIMAKNKKTALKIYARRHSNKK